MKLFTKIQTSALDVVRRTIEVSDNNDGDVVVSFHTARGRGTSPVTLSVSDFNAVVDALSFYAENGINRSEDTRSPADMIHETISVDDGVVSFRTRSGRGSRPTRIPQDEFAAVVNLLSESRDGVAEAATIIRTQIAEATEAEGSTDSSDSVEG